MDDFSDYDYFVDIPKRGILHIGIFKDEGALIRFLKREFRYVKEVRVHRFKLGEAWMIRERVGTEYVFTKSSESEQS